MLPAALGVKAEGISLQWTMKLFLNGGRCFRPVGMQGLPCFWQDPLPGEAWGVESLCGRGMGLVPSHSFLPTFGQWTGVSVSPIVPRRGPRSDYLQRLALSAWSIGHTLNLSCSRFVGLQIHSSLDGVERVWHCQESLRLIWASRRLALD